MISCGVGEQSCVTIATNQRIGCICVKLEGREELNGEVTGGMSGVNQTESTWPVLGNTSFSWACLDPPLSYLRSFNQVLGILSNDVCFSKAWEDLISSTRAGILPLQKKKKKFPPRCYYIYPHCNNNTVVLLGPRRIWSPLLDLK